MAIKVFSGRSYHYDYVSRKREIDVIKQLSDHENIVKLLAVEEQVTLVSKNAQVVIIMIHIENQQTDNHCDGALYWR